MNSNLLGRRSTAKDEHHFKSTKKLTSNILQLSSRPRNIFSYWWVPRGYRCICDGRADTPQTRATCTQCSSLPYESPNSTHPSSWRPVPSRIWILFIYPLYARHFVNLFFGQTSSIHAPQIENCNRSSSCCDAYHDVTDSCISGEEEGDEELSPYYCAASATPGQVACFERTTSASSCRLDPIPPKHFLRNVLRASFWATFPSSKTARRQGTLCTVFLLLNATEPPNPLLPRRYALGQRESISTKTQRIPSQLCSI